MNEDKKMAMSQKYEPLWDSDSYAILPKPMDALPTFADIEVLVRKCKMGDSRAWNQLVERFEALVWSSINRVGLEGEDAQDTFQKVFLILYKSLDRIESARSLPKWLATTAAREAIRQRQVSRNKSAQSLDEFENLDQMLASEEATAEQIAVAMATADVVRSAVSALPGKCPELLTMLYSEEDFSYEDIKAAMGIPAGSIGPTRARCIERLRKQLASMNFFESEFFKEDSASS